nr:hypothetical protein CPGR_00799 [Mycolicibacterium fortuitum subsp. fortuitum DSM 46621 = ATCC 6841 = JCM 6387]
MVSIMVFIVFIVAIMGCMFEIISGISAFILSMSGTICSKSAVMVSIPSRVSNTDRIDQHIGML